MSIRPLKMAKVWCADMFVNVSEASFEKKFSTKVRVKAEYDPQGMTIKIYDGM